MNASCRVEEPSVSNAGIALEGLRLRLDIRILPGSAKNGPRGRVRARVLEAELGERRLPMYRWAAVMVGLGVLIATVVVWIAAPVRRSPELTPPQPPTMTAGAPPWPSTRPALAGSAGVRGGDDAGLRNPAAEPSRVRPAPALEPRAPDLAASRASRLPASRQPSAPRRASARRTPPTDPQERAPSSPRASAERERPATRAGQQPATSARGQAPLSAPTPSRTIDEGAVGAESQAPRPRADMLDLFADPK